MQRPDLVSVLTTLRERIARHRRQGIGEQDTKAALIAPVLRALGWDLEDLDEVKLEYRRRGTRAQRTLCLERPASGSC